MLLKVRTVASILQQNTYVASKSAALAQSKSSLVTPEALNERRAAFVVDELRVQGSRCGPFGPALELLKTLDLTPLIDSTFPLAKAPEAVKRAGERGCLKVQIRVSDG